MDNFYRTENINVFKKWVYFQVVHDPRLRLEEYDERTYKIYYKERVARFVVWPIGIVEEAIMENDQLLFYLHYQFQNFHFATDLFERMIDKLTEEKSQNFKVLLCCTGGMTTGFFAEKMNKYCQINQLNLEIAATPAYHLQDVYKDYHLVLLAPQLRYKLPEFSRKLKPVIVKCIEPVTFATYDCQKLLEQIEAYEKSEEKL